VDIFIKASNIMSSSSNYSDSDASILDDELSMDRDGIGLLADALE
jgi:hypothetical protein